MIYGETIATGAPATCPDCGVTPELEVLLTSAFYIGTQCGCGPYSRESDYYTSEKDAQNDLDLFKKIGCDLKMAFFRRR